MHHCYRNLEGFQQYGVSCLFAQLGWSIFRIHPLQNLKVLRKHMEENYTTSYSTTTYCSCNYCIHRNWDLARSNLAYRTI